MSILIPIVAGFWLWSKHKERKQKEKEQELEYMEAAMGPTPTPEARLRMRDAEEEDDLDGSRAVIASAMCAADKCEELFANQQKRSNFLVSEATKGTPGHSIPDFQGRLSAYLQKSHFDPARDKLVAVTDEKDGSIAVYPTEQEPSEEAVIAMRNGWKAAANVSSAQAGPSGQYVGVDLGTPFNAAEFIKVSGAYEVPAAALKMTAPMFIA